MTLGLLFGDEEENEGLSFPHKIIHEYIAASYLVQEMKKDPRILSEQFQTWTDIKMHEEVYYFCIGCSADAKFAAVLIRHFCVVLKETMIGRMIGGHTDKLCHSGILKRTNLREELAAYNDKTELMQMVSTICQEAKVYRTACPNPACNDHIHVYPACKNTDPKHISQSELIIFTEMIKEVQMSFPDNVTNEHNRDGKSLVIFGDGKDNQDIGSINNAMSNCSITTVYLKNWIADSDQNVSNLFTKSVQTLQMEKCMLPGMLWNSIVCGLERGEALESLWLKDCTGITENMVTYIADLSALTTLFLQSCKLSCDMCGVLCRQFRQFNHLGGLHLGGNFVGEHVSHITEAIEAWGPVCQLRQLYLHDCYLPVEEISRLLSAVIQCCPQIDTLSIGMNHLGGYLSSFLAAPLVSLETLSVNNCSLQLEDVTSLTTALNHNILPCLRLLYMGSNNLTDSMMEPLLQAADTSHKGVLEIDLQNNYLSSEFTTRWSSQCRPYLLLGFHPQFLSLEELENIKYSVKGNIDRKGDLSVKNIADKLNRKIQKTGGECQYNDFVEVTAKDIHDEILYTSSDEDASHEDNEGRSSCYKAESVIMLLLFIIALAFIITLISLISNCSNKILHDEL